MNQNSNSIYNTKDIPIPNALTITINTSVPGNQTIKYKPNMSIKNIDKDLKTVWFDPLVSLDQSVIDKVPENIKVLEFFNKGLFESLINYHGNKKKITLEQAKKNKIIDRNISITLNNLFPTNGILYIKEEPYVIADVNWTKGSWKIDRKIKEMPEINASKITNPIMYSNIIKNDIKLGNNQLEQLPKDIIYGPNFNKDFEELSSIDREKELIDKKKIEESKLKSEADARTKLLEETKLKSEAEAEAIKKLLEETRLKSQAEAEAEARKKLIDTATLREAEETKLRESKAKKQSVLTIEDASKIKPELAIEDASKIKPELAIEDASKIKPELAEIEEIKNIQMSPNFLPKLVLSQASTNLLRRYFGSDDYYLMVNMIFKNMTEEQKVYNMNIFKNTTNIDVKESSNNISRTAYNFTITGVKQINSGGVALKKTFTGGLRVVQNSGGGDCLFLAVKDAINYYNYHNDISKKILFNRYGNGDNLFTTAVLRNIVSREIIRKYNTDPDFNETANNEARINEELLNNRFEEAITSTDFMLINSEEAYNTTLLDMYVSNDNFFVIIPNVISNRNRPFKIVENDNEIKNYIESVYYWGDQKTVDIINNILKINIIIIQNTNNKLKFPYITIKKTDNDKWNKYLFLYNTDNTHYELITFDYLIKKSPSSVMSIKKTIFDRDDNIIPPFYIIFFIFAEYFIKLPSEEKKQVTLFRNFLYAIQDSLNNIINDSSDKSKPIFIKKFEDTFGRINSINSMIPKGGSLNNGSENFLKKEDNQDKVQISFHITIDMELKKGLTMSKEQLSNIKCSQGWNKIMKSFADFSGKKYVIPPVYDNLSDKYNKKEDNNTKKNITGGKRRRKTIKNIKKR